MTALAVPVALADRHLAVSTQALGKRYGAQPALQSVDLHVPRGSFFLLVGPNGAGKSTLLKLLLDLVRASTGTASVFGLSPSRDGATVRANTGYVPEGADWAYGWMTIGQLLAHHAAYFDRWDGEYAATLIATFDVRLDRRLATLSKGQARRVHLLMALAHRPPLLLLDEPTDGLDPVMRDEVLGVLAGHVAETETTVVLSTHHVAEVETLADHVGVLRSGVFRAQLPIAELRANLNRYRMLVTRPLRDLEQLAPAIVRRTPPDREMEWTIWGEQHDVVAALERAGSTVSRVSPLSLSEATLELLSDPARAR